MALGPMAVLLAACGSATGGSVASTTVATTASTATTQARPTTTTTTAPIVDTGSGDGTTSWSSPQDIITALGDAGVQCIDPWEYDIVQYDLVFPEERLIEVDQARCGDYLDDRLYVMVYESERDRVEDVYTTVAISCEFLEVFPYVHGEEWAFESGYGWLDLAFWDEMAGVLGGEAVVAECDALFAYEDSLGATGAAPTLEGMRSALGEGEDASP
jgi:hypothetical protein